jgi:hypothetical protein
VPDQEQHDWRVTIVFDYTSDDEIDSDVLHDAIMDSFDTVDLEFSTEVTVYDEDTGDETDETRTVNVNCDNVREIEVVELKQ